MADDDDEDPPGEPEDTAPAPAFDGRVGFDELANGDVAGPGVAGTGRRPADVPREDTDDGVPDDGELMTDEEIDALPLFEP